MNILIFSHSGNEGGAENALRLLVQRLMQRHRIEMVLPSQEGAELTYYQALGIRCHVWGGAWALPDFSNALLEMASVDFVRIAEVFKPGQFDIAITNTIVKLQGAMVAKWLDIPHLFYAHEYLNHDELLPTSISARNYLDIIDACSAAIIPCSEFVASQFCANNGTPVLSTVEPYDYELDPIERVVAPHADDVLQIIGVQSTRKQPELGATIAKALRLRGRHVRLDVIGRKNLASARLERAVAKRKIDYRVVDHLSDPYALNAGSRVVSLVCAETEPYGLVVPESLRRGIPVVAARSGGPQALLPDAMLYDNGNLDDCVRRIEAVFDNYDQHVQMARHQYRALASLQASCQIVEVLDRELEGIRVSWHETGSTRLDQLLARVSTLRTAPLALEHIARHIALVARARGLAWTPAEVGARIHIEKTSPGTAVGEDMRRFDVVPFAMSAHMESLYRNGLGFAIELAATCNEPARLQMTAFIICALEALRWELGRRPGVLALGDGIGVDALRLARCDIDVDYMDYDSSATSEVARLNFDAFSQKAAAHGTGSVDVVRQIDYTYDAVMCLEVIEHVPDPRQFIAEVASYLKPGGLLFISECFNGIEDRWPTHLASNERFAGTMPLLLEEYFECTGFSRHPFGKPYVFRRKGAMSRSASLAWLNQNLTRHWIRSALDVGV